MNEMVAMDGVAMMIMRLWLKTHSKRCGRFLDLSVSLAEIHDGIAS